MGSFKTQKIDYLKKKNSNVELIYIHPSSPRSNPKTVWFAKMNDTKKFFTKYRSKRVKSCFKFRKSRLNKKLINPIRVETSRRE